MRPCGGDYRSLHRRRPLWCPLGIGVGSCCAAPFNPLRYGAACGEGGLRLLATRPVVGAVASAACPRGGSCVLGLMRRPSTRELHTLFPVL